MRHLNAAGLLPDAAGQPLIEWWRLALLTAIPVAGWLATGFIVG